MLNGSIFKPAYQNSLMYTEKGDLGKPYISIIIEKNEFDNIEWSYPVAEIVSNYNAMRENFVDWFHNCNCSDTIFYLDNEHKQYMNNPRYLSEYYLWNRLFVNDVKIRDIIENSKGDSDHSFEIEYGLWDGDSSVKRTKPVILNSTPDGKKFALLQMRLDSYSSYNYYIHTLFDTSMGADITNEFFEWLNHMREKIWFTMDHMNALVEIAQTHWKVPVFDIR